MKKIYLLFLLSLINNLNLLGQLTDDKFLPNIIPPSPEASKLGSYGDLSIGEFTGSPNFNIPLFDYNVSSINTNISLNYSSNGLRVDEMETLVGLGWNLSLGGIINRTVRDEDDFIFPLLDYPKNMTGGASNPEVADFFKKGSDDKANTEADLFSFNIGSLSGKFIISKTGIKILSKEDIKIEFVDNNNIPAFVLTDSKGIKYYFNEIETTITRISGDRNIPRPVRNSSITAWYISKINDNGNEIIFDYDSSYRQFVSSESQSLTFSNPAIQNSCLKEFDAYYNTLYQKPPQLGFILSNNMMIYGKKLKRIRNTKNSNIIDIEYLDNTMMIKTIKLLNNTSLVDKIDFIFEKTLNDRYFLKRLESKSQSKNYSFEYNDLHLFPKRLSKAQDHWGYFNGANNANIVPKNLKYYERLNNVNYRGADKEPNYEKSKIGLLRKIVYPTKGYSEIEYEANDYYGTVLENSGSEKSFRMSIVNDKSIKKVKKIENISVKSSQVIKFIGSAKFNDYDCSERDNIGRLKHKLLFTVNAPIYSIDQHGNPFYYQNNSIDLMDDLTKTFYLKADPNRNYQLELSSNWNCTQGGVSFNYNDTETREYQANITTGGNRVSKIVDYDDGFTPKIKKYYYSKLDNLKTSSGDKGIEPYYVDVSKWEDACYNVLTDNVVSSGSIISIFENGKNNIYYKYVTISNGGDNFENGGVEKEFIINKDYWGNQIFGSEQIMSAPWTNFGWNNGYLKKELFFNKSKIVNREINNSWVSNKIDNNPSYSIRKNYTPKLDKRVTYTCNSQDIIRENNGYNRSCNTKHNHIWWVPSGKCIAKNNNNIAIPISNPCYKKPLNYSLSYPWNISHIAVVEYDNISLHKYLSKTTTTDYLDGGGSIVTEVNYNYDSPNHLQLTKQITTNSKGEVLTTEYQYPSDLTTGYAESSKMTSLVNSNRVAEPVIVKQKVDNLYVSEVHNQYAEFNGILQKSAVFQKKREGINLNLATDRKIVYNSYDSQGNITQYTAENKIPVAIIWGYNGQYPIAKIEGASYSEVSAFVTALQDLSNNGTLAKTSFNDLRTSLTKAMITTYVYQPLVGVTSITGPNGLSEYYKYDEANRLKEIRNDKDELLKTFQYNYKN